MHGEFSTNRSESRSRRIQATYLFLAGPTGRLTLASRRDIPSSTEADYFLVNCAGDVKRARAAGAKNIFGVGAGGQFRAVAVSCSTCTGSCRRLPLRTTVK